MRVVNEPDIIGVDDVKHDSCSPAKQGFTNEVRQLVVTLRSILHDHHEDFSCQLKQMQADILAVNSGTRKELYTVKQAAEVLSRAPATVRRYTRSGRLPFHRIKGTGERGPIHIRHDDLMNFSSSD